jgi:hypothetical protein
MTRMQKIMLKCLYIFACLDICVWLLCVAPYSTSRCIHWRIDQGELAQLRYHCEPHMCGGDNRFAPDLHILVCDELQR